MGGGGWIEGARQDNLDGIRLCSISGRAGAVVDQIHIEYIEGYRPSQLILANQKAVLDFQGRGWSEEVVVEYESTRLSAISRINTQEIMSGAGANIGAEILGFQIGLELSDEITSTNVQNMAEQIEEVLRTHRKEIRRTGDNYGFWTATVQVWKDPTGRYFVMSTSPEELDVKTPDEYPTLSGYINLHAPVADIVGMDSVPDPAIGGIERLTPRP